MQHLAQIGCMAGGVALGLRVAAAVIPHFSARQPTLPIHDCSAAAAGAKNAAPCVVDALYGERAAGAEVSRLDCNSSHKNG